ncbi:MAG: hypothetical protein V4596_12550 [Bdellovibrionota bacterium]
MKLLALLIVILITPPSFAGNDGGSGGDAYAKEFEMLARELHKTFKQDESNPALIKWRLKPSLFELVVNTTLLRSADGSEVILDAMEVDAINYKNRRLILINQDRWRQRSLLQRLELTLHEYLGILDIEKGNYIVTNELSDLIVQTYNRIKNSNSNQINLFYGNQKIGSSMNSAIICDQSSPAYADAVELAKNEAITKCSLQNKSCKILSLTAEPIISSLVMGYKYCSVTAIAK